MKKQVKHRLFTLHDYLFTWGCRMKAGLKSGVLRVVICFCKSSVTVGTKGGYYYMPSPAGKGDREAVDEENILWQL